MRTGVLVIRLLLAGLLVVSVLAGCQRASREADQAPEVRMTLAVTPEPPAMGPAHLVITLADKDGTPVEGATLRIKGDMSHAGMVPVRAEATGGAAGVYEADLGWTMGGDWIVTVTAVLPDGRVTARQFELAVLSAGQ